MNLHERLKSIVEFILQGAAIEQTQCGLVLMT